MNNSSQYLTIKQAAELLDVTPTTLRNWDRAGKLVAERDPQNGYRVYSVDKVSSLLQERSNSVYRLHPDTVEAQQLPMFEFTFETETNRPSVQDARSLRFIIRQMSQAFRDSLGGGLLERFEEISKILYCKLHDERLAQSDLHYKKQFYTSHKETQDEIYERANTLYGRAIALLPDIFTNGHRLLSADRAAVTKIISLLQSVDLSSVPADVKGIVYEELVRNTFEKSENQQFFTPRPVVEFMVKFANPQLQQTLCDPACGSGGFLIEASHHIAQQLKKRGSATEEMITTYLGDRLIGLEIERRMAWVAQMNLIMHGDGHGNIHHLPNGGSLVHAEQLDRLVLPNTLDLILTNPPFGSDFTDKAQLERYKLGRGRVSRRRGVLFIERCVEWLRPGGLLGIIIDDSVLNGNSNQDVRDLILQSCIVEAVISLPDVTFMPYATAKASILFLRKRSKEYAIQPPVFMAISHQVGRKPNGDPLYSTLRDENGQPLLQNDLPVVLKAWQQYSANGEIAVESLFNIFICPPDCLEESRLARSGIRLDVQFHHPSRRIAEEAINDTIYPTPKLAELVTVRNVTAIPAKQDPDEIWNYIGLANIAANTGEYTVTKILGQEIKSTVRQYCPGEILFSKLRPELRKCALIHEGDDEGYTSSECLVFCTLEQAQMDSKVKPAAPGRSSLAKWQIDSEYLAFMLRSDLVFGQLVYQITGVGRPRVGQSAILGVRIPVPPLSIQREIVSAARMAWTHYSECRKRSEIALQEGEVARANAYEYAYEKLKVF